MIIKVGGGLEPLGPIGVYAYARLRKKKKKKNLFVMSDPVCKY